MRRLSTRSLGFKAIVSAAAATTLLGATVAGPAAGAATNGVGTATSDATILNVDLRGITDINVLKDVSRSSTDPTVGTPEAVVSVTPVSATGFLNAVTKNLPTFESRSRGPVAETSGSVVEVPAELAPVLAGKVTPALLKALVDSQGAKATLSNELTELTVGGAVLNANSAGNDLTTHAAPTETKSTRAADLDSLTALDLGTLLSMIGIDLTDLPIGVLTQILENAGVGVGDLDPAAAAESINGLAQAASEVQAIVSDLETSLTILSAQLVPDGLTSDVEDLLNEMDLLDGVDLSVLAEVQGLLDDILAQLLPSLDEMLVNLNNLALLSVSDAGVEVSALAKEEVKDSSATVKASIGAITVAGQTIPGVDLLDTVAQVQGVIDTAQGALDGLLGQITDGTGLPSLSGLVKVSLFDKGTSVAKVKNYTESLAAITLLTVSINPPAALGDLLDGIVSQTGVADLVEDLGGELAALPSVGGVAAGEALKSAVNVQALGNGAEAKVLSFSASANFTTDPGGGTGGELPRTGGTTTTLPILVAAVMVAAALGTRRWLRLATVTTKR